MLNMETRKLHQLRRNAYKEYFGVTPAQVAFELRALRKEKNLVINTPPTQETD
jgi:hypothetical protein